MRKLLFTLAVMFALIASSSAQSFGVTGPTTIYEGRNYVWYVENEPSGTDYVAMHCSNPYGDVTWPQDQVQFDEYRVTPEGTGTIRLVAQARWGGEWTNYFYVEVIEDPVPDPSPAPSISGPSTADAYSTEDYTMPSGEDDYQWDLPYGTYSMSEFENEITIFFEEGGLKIIKGRYKENDVWSLWGYKNVTIN